MLKLAVVEAVTGWIHKESFSWEMRRLVLQPIAESRRNMHSTK